MSSELGSATDASSIEKIRWRIDPSRSRVEFQVRTFWGMMTVRGHFDGYTGTLDLAADPAVELAIAADSLDSANRKRDAHLRSADFFDVKEHPQVSFASESASLSGERLKVHGRLHAGGKSMPLDLEATLRRVGDELEVEAVTEADQGQLGMSSGQLGMIRTPAKLVVKGRLVRDA